MKTFVILTDTHRNIEAIKKLKNIMLESDYVCHLGDHDSDMRSLVVELGRKLVTVKGNCDGGGEDKILNVEGYRILLTHGHKYGVKDSLYTLLLKAKEEGVNAVFYGHTHNAKVEEIDGITFINAGNMVDYTTYCYAVLTGEKLIAKIVPVYR